MVPEQKIGTTDLAQALAVASLHLDVTSYLCRTKGVFVFVLRCILHSIFTVKIPAPFCFTVNLL